MMAISELHDDNKLNSDNKQYQRYNDEDEKKIYYFSPYLY